MFERLAFLVWMALTALSFGFLGLSPWFRWPDPGAFVCLGSVAGLVLAWALRLWGKSRLHFDEHQHSFDTAGSSGFLPGSPEHEARAENLRKLFYEWDALAERQARGEGDIWQVAEIRREAQALLDADPQLRVEFDYHVSRHPELGQR